MNAPLPGRLAVLHTVTGLVDFFRPLLSEHLPDVETYHMVDESLLEDAIANVDAPSLRWRLADHVASAHKAGVAGILVTCSSVSELVDAVRPLSSVPLFKIDDAMAASAVGDGKNIALICTTSSTVAPSTRQLTRAASEAGREVEVRASLVAGAFDALKAGNRDRHDELVLQECMRSAEEADVIVLAQASLARLEDSVRERAGRRVVSSPVPCLKDIARRLGASAGARAAD